MSSTSDAGDPRTPRCATSSAFSLIELLVVVVVIGLLASLLLPSLGRAKERAHSVRCLNQLRQLGVAMLCDAEDNQETVRLQFPEDPQKTWGTALATGQNLTSSNLFLCPGYPPRQFRDWRRIYGIRLDPPEECTGGELQDVLLLARVPRPASYLQLTDTTSRGRGGFRAEQYFYYRVASENEVHARHEGGANGFFLDGHAQRSRRPHLEELGIHALYESDVVPAYFGSAL